MYRRSITTIPIFADSEGIESRSPLCLPPLRRRGARAGKVASVKPNIPTKLDLRARHKSIAERTNRGHRGYHTLQNFHMKAVVVEERP